MVDPTGFREIVAANPLLITGVYILLAMGGLLFLLGFLGCCGAIRENKCLLLFVSTALPAPPRGPCASAAGTRPEVWAKQAILLESGSHQPFPCGLAAPASTARSVLGHAGRVGKLPPDGAWSRPPGPNSQAPPWHCQRGMWTRMLIYLLAFRNLNR